MKRGPHWSDEGVQALLIALRGRLENVNYMTDEKLNQECAKRVALEGFVGRSQVIKVEALKDWHWNNAVKSVVGEVEKTSTEKRVEPYDVNKELENIVGLIKERGIATDEVIRKKFFEGREKVCAIVIEHGLTTGRIKRQKTENGAHALVLA